MERQRRLRSEDGKTLAGSTRAPAPELSEEERQRRYEEARAWRLTEGDLERLIDALIEGSY